jgi:hypothetical protein
MLLCELCDLGFHTYCLDPPLADLPEGDWYARACLVAFVGNLTSCTGSAPSAQTPTSRPGAINIHQRHITLTVVCLLIWGLHHVQANNTVEHWFLVAAGGLSQVVAVLVFVEH